MELHRFFVAPEDIDGASITVKGAEFEHMSRVLRLKAGFKTIVCANDGIERFCTIESMFGDRAILKETQKRTADAKRIRLTLYAGLLKNRRLDFAIQKAVELGVDEIIPLISQNTAEKDFNRERAERIALEAAKQCGASYLTRIGHRVEFDEMLKSLSRFDTAVFAYEGEKKNKIANGAYTGRTFALIVGSEGGFTPIEAEAAREAGAYTVTLGRRILRAETADIVASALLLDALGELDYE